MPDYVPHPYEQWHTFDWLMELWKFGLFCLKGGK